MISFHLSCTRCITILHVSIHDMISIFLLRHISDFFKFFLWHYNAAERMAPTLTISLAFLDIPIKLCKKKKKSVENRYVIQHLKNFSLYFVCFFNTHRGQFGRFKPYETNWVVQNTECYCVENRYMTQHFRISRCLFVLFLFVVSESNDILIS